MPKREVTGIVSDDLKPVGVPPPPDKADSSSSGGSGSSGSSRKRNKPSLVEDSPVSPDLIRRASTTILSSIGASRSKPLAALSAEEEGDLRKFYLHLMEKREKKGWAAVEGTLMQVRRAPAARRRARPSFHPRGRWLRSCARPTSCSNRGGLVVRA